MSRAGRDPVDEAGVGETDAESEAWQQVTLGPPRTLLTAHGLFRGRTVPAFVADLEAVLGLIFAAWLVVAVFFGGVVMVAFEWEYAARRVTLPVRVMHTVAWLLASFFQARSFALLGSTMESAPDPRPVFVALRQRRRGLITGSRVAAWWLASGAAMVFLADRLVHLYEFHNPTPVEQAISWVVRVMAVFASAYASNAYLVCAVAVLVPREGVLRRVWQFRIVVDTAVALAFAIPQGR